MSHLEISNFVSSFTLGGLGFTLSEIGISMAVIGVLLLPLTILLFPMVCLPMYHAHASVDVETVYHVKVITVNREFVCM